MSALIWSPFDSIDQAKPVCRTLLEDKLIACANFIPGVRSLYRWDGEIGEGKECGVLLKTDGALLDMAISRLEELHPYETPAILGWRCDSAGDATQAWLADLTPPNRA